MSTVAAGTRERLLSAAQELVEEGGYGAASVLAIAERAGVAAGTLYRHWPSKGELFAELFRVVCDREIAAMEAAAKRTAARTRATHVQTVQTVLLTFAERALRNPRLAWALIAEPVDPLVDAERIAYRREYARRLVDGLREAIAAGEIPEQDVELTAAALVGGVGEALVGPLSPVPGTAPPAGEIIAALRTFVARAVGARAA
ncbi:MAG TPA: TetR/AcrR family transcriptional regulator [Solirubrobacteraceae bacterium]|nr:TetR/AcrR family transcriptional regulator [Solirubrobacteraceae bacterium]